MRFLHTADWHLGRIFHNVHLTEDQAHVLDLLIALVRDSRPDVFIIAGDVYDRAVPPPDAVSLLSDTLDRIVRGLAVPVILIAGNHDSPERIAFGSPLLADRGLHTVGTLTPDTVRLVLNDDSGPVHFYAVPYGEPATLRHILTDPSLNDHRSAMQAVTARIRRMHSGRERSVLVAHCFVSGGAESESERPLSVGGAGTVDSASFDGFQYVALGHLHRPQTAGKEHIQYSGSLLKYSFSEADHAKSVNLVELDGKGACHVERVPLTSKRDVRIVRGSLREILEAGAKDPRKGDYLKVELTDTVPILDPMGRLREYYPNVLHIERPALISTANGEVPQADHRKLTDQGLFEAFFEQMTQEKPTPEQVAAYVEVVEKIRSQQREASE